MATAQEQPRVVSASREIAAGTGRIFELIADPAQQPGWDGNDNLAQAPAGRSGRRLTGSRPSPKHPDRPPPRGGHGKNRAHPASLEWQGRAGTGAPVRADGVQPAAFG
jgi:hypothetical protein